MPHPKDDVVTARVIFKGLMLGRINSNFAKLRYEIGMIECPEHYPTIQIKKNGVAEPPFEWPKDHDLIIKVVNPVQDGVQLHAPSPDHHEAAFNFALDVEGSDLHLGGIDVDTIAFGGRRIGVTAGLFYTEELTAELDLYTWVDDKDPGSLVRNFGKIAKVTGVNVVCQQDQQSGIAIVDASTGNQLRWLPALPETSYRILVDNDCFRDAETQTAAQQAAHLTAVGSDFRLMYRVMRPSDPSDTQKFDFARTDLPNGIVLLSPDTCNPSTGGGRGKTIGLDWSHA